MFWRTSSVWSFKLLRFKITVFSSVKLGFIYVWADNFFCVNTETVGFSAESVFIYKSHGITPPLVVLSAVLRTSWVTYCNLNIILAVRIWTFAPPFQPILNNFNKPAEAKMKCNIDGTIYEVLKLILKEIFIPV